MANNQVDPLDIADGVIDLLQDPVYAHADPLSEPVYFFDYASFHIRDPTLLVATYWMDDDEIKQYAMLVIDLRGRLETKAQEFLQAE